MKVCVVFQDRWNGIICCQLCLFDFHPLYNALVGGMGRRKFRLERCPKNYELRHSTNDADFSETTLSYFFISTIGTYPEAYRIIFSSSGVREEFLEVGLGYEQKLHLMISS